MSELIGAYRSALAAILERIAADAGGALARAADAVAAALVDDRVVHVAGAGHSHMLTQELFYRAGGLAAIQPMWRTDLMLHEGARASTDTERRAGVAEDLLAAFPLVPGDLLVVVSTSGRNVFPVELALGAKRRGATVIAVTSLQATRAAASRHPSGQVLADVADIVIDSHVPSGDAVLPVPGLAQRMGPVSTIAGAFILNAMMAEAAARAALRGLTPEVFPSANGPGDAQAAADIAGRWQDRIRGL